jgi:hypothetical protein
MKQLRTESIDQLARAVCGHRLDHPTRVAVDGTTASGKSTLARELTAAVTSMGRPVVHLSMDGYHHPRQHRWRQGSLSAEGYYEDAYDFQAFLANVLLPLGPQGDGYFRNRIIDLAANQPIDEPPVHASLTPFSSSTVAFSSEPNSQITGITESLSTPASTWHSLVVWPVTRNLWAARMPLALHTSPDTMPPPASTFRTDVPLKAHRWW